MRFDGNFLDAAGPEPFDLDHQLETQSAPPCPYGCTHRNYFDKSRVEPVRMELVEGRLVCWRCGRSD